MFGVHAEEAAQTKYLYQEEGQEEIQRYKEK